ncbi:hypothetical protein DFA_07854 [Cavenderia fasciculata]|uniref:Transmembrane protein n=1 Tax=Cavenderia fasciculata TaxID=261658 RepID=F4Q3Q8_CACFS|nr:uncharacterized protein DFA_07854 [Cavenderia fasciculata]EGG16874.1 hypothetical protein DFA_07854 [Cavenderia fasciculata]|eukprot:XP_004355348.1 hypothetical protein DFA_07854 [Cavenderia fasciculata]
MKHGSYQRLRKISLWSRYVTLFLLLISTAATWLNLFTINKTLCLDTDNDDDAGIRASTICTSFSGLKRGTNSASRDDYALVEWGPKDGFVYAVISFAYVLIMAADFYFKDKKKNLFKQQQKLEQQEQPLQQLQQQQDRETLISHNPDHDL